MGILGRILKTNRKKLPFAAGASLAVTAVLAVCVLGVGRVDAAGTDCDDNAIIKCGFSTPAEFIRKVKANDSLNGHHDLQAVYNAFNLSGSDYNNFANNAVAGEVERNGNIVVNGQVVATGAMSIGRIAAYHGSGYFTKKIAGHDYYGNVVNKTFAPGVASLPIYAFFDSQGTLQFAVMKSCGNPTFGSPVKTSASCKVLNASPVPGKLNSYSFTAAANTTGNARITKYVYDFGDGSTPVTKATGTAAVGHTYTRAGTFTATVTEYASVPGNSNLKLTVISTCKKVITVKIPFFNCIQLTGAILDKSKLSYSFTASASFGNGAGFTGADFNFGDGHVQNGVKPNGTTVTVTHAYAAAGRFDVSALLHFTVNGKPVTAPACKALVTPQTVTPECKPGVPVGSPACLPPCQPGSSVPPGSSGCTPPSLPNTGAGDTILIFAAVAVAGFLVYRQVLFNKHKAAFLAAQYGTSVLPLDDPLNEAEPLVKAPAAPKRRSLRRNRPF